MNHAIPPAGVDGAAAQAVPEVSVIVPHYNDLAGLDRCLQALARQTLAPDRFEIIVGDNGSPVGEEAVVAVIAGRARLTIAVERGAGPARNAAAALARGDVLAFIDSDCIAEPEWLEGGIAALAGADFVGGRVKVLIEHDGALSGAEAFERVFAFDFRHYVEEKGFAGSGNLFCRRDVFAATGGFRTGVSEDVEWSHRARTRGFRLAYAPGAVIAHPARRDWESLVRKWRRLNDEAFKLASEKPLGRVRWTLKALAMPASIIAHIPRIWLSPELDTMGDRLRATGTLARLRLWRGVDALALAARLRR